MPSGISSVPERDPRDVVLDFLAEHPIPLKPKEIYGGLIRRREITFSYSTVKNIVSEFHESGLIERYEIDSVEGEVQPIPNDSNRRGYYIITEKGKSRQADPDFSF